MKTAVVYWIRHKNHTDVFQEGYVGVARNFKKRIQRHIHSVNKNKHSNYHLQEALNDLDDIIMDIIFEGEEKLCYIKEYEYRPQYNIGWNIVPGGSTGSTTLGKKMSDEFCKHRSELMKGNKIAVGNNKPKTEEHKKKIGLAHKGKTISEEQRKNHSKKMTGKKHTAEHNEKIRLAALGKKRGPYKKRSV